MNTGGIIFLIAVLLFFVFEMVSLMMTIFKKRKQKKELIAKKEFSEGTAENKETEKED